MAEISKARYRYDWAKTKILRKILPKKDDRKRVIESIRRKVKALGSRYEDGNSNCRGYTYHPIVFPEFNNVAYHRDVSGCDERLKAMLSAVEIREGDRVLDVGANVGFFSFSMAKKGAIVDSVELQSESFEIGAALAKLYDMNVSYINKPISRKLLHHLDNSYKCALLLSVVHWVMKQCGREETIELLRDIAQRSEIIFFEVPSTAEDGMVVHEDFTSLKKVKSFLVEALPEHNATELLIGEKWGNRVLFKISRA